MLEGVHLRLDEDGDVEPDEVGDGEPEEAEDGLGDDGAARVALAEAEPLVDAVEHALHEVHEGAEGLDDEAEEPGEDAAAYGLEGGAEPVEDGVFEERAEW